MCFFYILKSYFILFFSCHLDSKKFKLGPSPRRKRKFLEELIFAFSKLTHYNMEYQSNIPLDTEKLYYNLNDFFPLNNVY